MKTAQCQDVEEEEAHDEQLHEALADDYAKLTAAVKEMAAAQPPKRRTVTSTSSDTTLSHGVTLIIAFEHAEDGGIDVSNPANILWCSVQSY